MGKEVVNLNVTKTQTYYMDVQLDESINLEDLDDISFEYLVSQSTLDGEDSYETSWEHVNEEVRSSEDILCLNESGEPYFKKSSKDE